MPTINNITFSVKFDLTGAPTLVLTDGSTYPTGAVGRFSITLPDNYTRVGDYNSPDISSSGAAFSYPLRLDSKGGVQTGQYTILYEIKTTDNVITTFTRTFQFTYVPVDLKMTELFDVFTPSLKYQDDTIYQVPGFNNGATTRAWSATSTPTGSLSATTQLFDLKKNNNYYDAYYTVILTASIDYAHQVYSFLTVSETITRTINTYASTPPTLDAIVAKITDLRYKVDTLVNNTQASADAKADFEYTQTTFTHIIDKLKVNNTTNVFTDLKDLIAVLVDNHIPPYTPTNAPILPYDLGSFIGAPKWGGISGNITQQTDLSTYLQTLTKHDNYIHDQQVAASTWTITHNMGKFPSVTIVDTAGDEMDAQVNHNSNNQLIITFSAAVSGKAYLN